MNNDNDASTSASSSPSGKLIGDADKSLKRPPTAKSSAVSRFESSSSESRKNQNDVQLNSIDSFYLENDASLINLDNFSLLLEYISCAHSFYNLKKRSIDRSMDESISSFTFASITLFN